MSDTHSFNVDVAKEVGVNAAILLQSIKWWCDKNRANRRNHHDGLWWTYNSIKAWQELYPYLGKSAISSALKRLEERGYIRTGNYNKSAYDHTIWYAITEEGLSLFGESICRKSEIEEAKSGNGNLENGEPIPDTYQLVTDAPKKERKGQAETYDSIIDGFTDDRGLRDALRQFLRYRVASSHRAKKEFTNYALKQNLGRLRNLASDPETMTAIVNQTIEKGWSGFFALKEAGTDRRNLYTAEQNEEFDSYSWSPDQVTDRGGINV